MGVDGGGGTDPRISSHLMHIASLNDACSYGQIQLRGCECVWGCGWRGVGGVFTDTHTRCASLNDACSYGQIQLRVWVVGGLLTHTLSVPV